MATRLLPPIALLVTLTLSGCLDYTCPSEANPPETVRYPIFDGTVSLGPGSWTAQNISIPTPSYVLQVGFHGNFTFWGGANNAGRILILRHPAFENWRYGAATDGGVIFQSGLHHVGTILKVDTWQSCTSCVLVFDNRADNATGRTAHAHVEGKAEVCQ